MLLVVAQSSLKRNFLVKDVLHAGVLTFFSCSLLATTTAADPKDVLPARRAPPGEAGRGGPCLPTDGRALGSDRIFYWSPDAIWLSPLFESKHVLPGAPSPASLPESWRGQGACVSLVPAQTCVYLLLPLHVRILPSISFFLLPPPSSSVPLLPSLPTPLHTTYSSFGCVHQNAL